jgi:capsular exopolysaccharide synthesis family protein
MNNMLPSPINSTPSLYRPWDGRPAGESSWHQQEEPLLSLGHYFWLVRKAWWKIAIATVTLTGLAAFAAYHLTPVYESTARLSIDMHQPSSLMGNDGQGGGNGDSDEFFNTELQQIQSDTVLRPVVQQFNLFSDEAKENASLSKLAADAPVSLKNLTVYHPPNSYLINISYRSTDTYKAAEIANAVARSYIVRGREMRARAALDESEFMEKQLSDLKRNMDNSDVALASYEKQLGVINSDEKTSILAARLQQLNTEYTDAQNDRMKKEVDLHAYESGSLAALEVSPQATALTKMEENVRAAQEKMDAARSIYGPANPEYKHAASALAEVTRQYNAMQTDIGKRVQVEFDKARNHENLVRSELAKTKGESDALSVNSTRYQELKREAESNRALYSELFRKIKEAGINGAFDGSAVRIADPARPELRPVFPKKTLFIGLGFLFSLMASIIAVIVADVTDKSLRDPNQARREIGLDVVGILPHVRKASELSHGGTRPAEIMKTSSRWFGSADFYEESIRALLSTIRMSRMGHPLRTILVTSAVPGEGKSSCVAHLATAHARQGYRTLLIDADLRCPTQHTAFEVSDAFGLADAVAMRKTLAEIRQNVPGNINLDVITAGQGNFDIYEGVGKAVEDILSTAREEYDLVFIDAPPMLCFSEPIHLACVADGVLVVCRAGATSKQAVSELLVTLQRLGASTVGIVLNQVQQKMSSRYEPFHSYYRRFSRAGAA